MDWGAVWVGIQEGRQDRTYVLYVKPLAGNPTPQEMLLVDKKLHSKTSACFSCDGKQVFQEEDGSWQVRVFMTDEAKIAQARAVLIEELGFEVLREGEFDQVTRKQGRINWYEQTLEEAIYVLSGGNPGGIVALSKLLAKGALNEEFLRLLDELELYDWHIAAIYAMCENDPKNMLALLIAMQCCVKGFERSKIMEEIDHWAKDRKHKIEGLDFNALKRYILGVSY